MILQNQITRHEFLDILITFKDKQLIKVVTGIRRCGKSTLLNMFHQWLLDSGIKSEQIIHINLEDGDFFDITDFRLLYEYINSRLVSDKKNYVIIDEVQNIPEFQKACDALYVKKNVDLYLTGSNAKLLSGDLATLLSGRYIQIKMLPLSFKEYISAVGEDNLLQKYSDYIENGSFPYTLSLSTKQENRAYLDGVFNSILIKDIALRGKISDLNMLTDVIKFLFDSVGSPVSATNIANTMTSRGRKISVPTVENYIGFLCDAYILYKAERFDIKGKELLSGAAKYYIADTGLRFYLLGSKNVDMGHLLENIVYLELLRRGYKVNVGKFNDNEVDFVATNDCDTEYYQVAYTVADEKTLDRELKPLNAINDHNAKYLLTTDFTPYTTHNGIKQMNVFKWLLGEM
ncbi:ATP-binding protein [Treponema sp.]|uniref:ATP-binding protein n=1 Tax=Treponema sp. TaxID=166 RepID=UPI003FD73CE8